MVVLPTDEFFTKFELLNVSVSILQKTIEEDIKTRLRSIFDIYHSMSLSNYL